ncbi:MAG: hypothetical protein IH623_26705 [Verrucomicrobia bacterium]|nr:hypothetical protein [Verrucomicrobiota bacterium]
MNTNDTPEPNFPCPFSDALRFIKGESIPEKLAKVRRFIVWQLRARRRKLPPDQFEKALKAVFLARQRKPFTDQADLDAFAAEWLTWWNTIELPAVRQRNARFLRKPLDPENGEHGNASA